MELSGWLVAHIGLVDELDIANCVKRYVCCEFEPIWAVRALKAFQARIQRSLPTSRKAHQCDTVGVNPRMLRNVFERPIRIVYLSELSQLILV